MSPDVVIAPQRGLPAGLIIPDAELAERFSRSTGPGGQSVNTTDSRVELSWDVAASTVLTDEPRPATDFSNSSPPLSSRPPRHAGRPNRLGRRVRGGWTTSGDAAT